MVRSIAFVRGFLLLLLVAIGLWLSGGGAALRADADDRAPTAPTGTTFTYQGRLDRNGVAYSGDCVATFTLWNAAAAGTQVGPTRTVNPLTITNGLFDADLDFGSVFEGEARWLQMEVQCPEDGAPQFVARDALNGVPYTHGLRPGLRLVGNTAGDSLYIETGATNSNAIHGKATATGSIGVWGEGVANTGVYGLSASGAGVWGRSTAGSGVYGESTHGAGVRGVSVGTYGVLGNSSSTGTAGISTQWIGVFGQSTSTTGGSGVWGENMTGNGAGVIGISTANSGVFGRSTDGAGVWGESTNKSGVVGVASTANEAGVFGRATVAGGTGVWGRNDQANSIGVKGTANAAGGVGVWGESTNNTGVYGRTSGAGANAVWGVNTTGGVAGRFDGIVTISGGADLAELFDVSGTTEPGTVVIIDPATEGGLVASNRAYDPLVVGVISGANGVAPGLTLYQEGGLDGTTAVAIAGRVYVKAEAFSGPIAPGDLLTTSGMPGHAMAVRDRDRAYGAVFGKALTGLDSGTGLILVLITLQ